MLRIGNWLRNKLFKALNFNVKSSSPTQIENLSEEEVQAYVQVLIEILGAIGDSDNDSEVVYPLFARNIDKLDDIFAKVLRYRATNTFNRVKANEAESIATGIFYFWNLFLEFPLCNKAINMEIAIASYETVLKVYNQKAFPQQWAIIQNHLGIAYRQRIKGDRAENIEKAIS